MDGGAKMLSGELNTIIIGKKPISTYVLSAIIMFNQGAEEIILKARGDVISKAVDVFNALRDRLGDSIELAGIEIGSENVGSKRTSYIKIKVKRTF